MLKQIRVYVHNYSAKSWAKVPEKSIRNYYVTADVELRFEIVRYDPITNPLPYDFFKSGDRNFASQQINRILNFHKDKNVLHLFVSDANGKFRNDAGDLTGGDGAIVCRSRRAVAVFLTSDNFQDYFDDRERSIGLLQVCIHEIGHALMLTHEMDERIAQGGERFRHIMRPAKIRRVFSYDEPWEAKLLRQERPSDEQGVPISCHPLPIEGLSKIQNATDRDLMPGSQTRFPKETLCQC